MSSFDTLYNVIISRSENSEEGSYTGYLFREGIDKILKKIGEEGSETIIAAKGLEAEPDNNDKREALKNEICDLLYHIFVLMAERKIGLDEIEEIIKKRSAKSGNLKQMKDVNMNS